MSSESKTKPLTMKGNGPQNVHRKDNYNDTLSGFIDENLLEVAKLVALKKKIQLDIFDSSKQY